MVRLKRRSAASKGSLSRTRTLGIGVNPFRWVCGGPRNATGSPHGMAPVRIRQARGSRSSVINQYIRPRGARQAPVSSAFWRTPIMRVLGIETSCDETGVAVYDSADGLLAHALP